MKVKREVQRGQRNHLAYARSKAAPAKSPVKLSLAGKASQALFPWPLASYPGQRKLTRQLLINTPANTIRDWMRGRRAAPQWARDMLREELERRAYEMLDIAEKLK